MDISDIFPITIAIGMIVAGIIIIIPVIKEVKKQFFSKPEKPKLLEENTCDGRDAKYCATCNGKGCHT